MPQVYFTKSLSTLSGRPPTDSIQLQLTIQLELASGESLEGSWIVNGFPAVRHGASGSRLKKNLLRKNASEVPSPLLENGLTNAVDKVVSLVRQPITKGTAFCNFRGLLVELLDELDACSI